MTLPTTDSPKTETKCPRSYRNSSNNQENLLSDKVKRNGRKLVKLTSEERAEKNRQKNQLRYLNETPEQRELRLKKQREYKESRTPEQKEASRLKNALYTRRYRQEQLDLAKTLEEKEALLKKRKEYSKNYREKIKNLAKTPEEREALRLKLVIEKRRSVEKLKKLPNRDCKGRLCKPEEIGARKRKRIKEDEEQSLLTLKKRWQATMKMREYRRKIQTMKMIGQSTASSSGHITTNSMKAQNTFGQPIAVSKLDNRWNMVELDSCSKLDILWNASINKKITSNFPIAVEEIKIEKEVLQETTIKTIPSLQNANSIFNIQNESIEGAHEPSYDSFVSHARSNGNFDYSPSFIDQYNFPNTKSHSSKIGRRKTRVQKSLNSMRELIDATARGDRFAVFGKYIAQKLRTSNKDVAEVNIAKLLIDNVLQDLAIDYYNSETHCAN